MNSINPNNNITIIQDNRPRIGKNAFTSSITAIGVTAVTSSDSRITGERIPNRHNPQGLGNRTINVIDWNDPASMVANTEAVEALPVALVLDEWDLPNNNNETNNEFTPIQTPPNTDSLDLEAVRFSPEIREKPKADGRGTVRRSMEIIRDFIKKHSPNFQRVFPNG